MGNGRASWSSRRREKAAVMEGKLGREMEDGMGMVETAAIGKNYYYSIRIGVVYVQILSNSSYCLENNSSPSLWGAPIFILHSI